MRDVFFAELRKRIGSECVYPLVGVFSILPVSGMKLVIFIRAVFECSAVSRRQEVFLSLGFAILDRINSRVEKLAILAGLLTHLGKLPVLRRTQSHVSGTFVECEAQNPRLRTGRADLQVKAISIQMHARFFFCVDCDGT